MTHEFRLDISGMFEGVMTCICKLDDLTHQKCVISEESNVEKELEVDKSPKVQISLELVTFQI